ncbi:MAG: bifunctional diguanylate cyclase/phosphohydrolase, partial [Janthinobacterium lividum]
LAGETADYEIEFQMRCKDGTHRWVLARGAALRDAGGLACRMAGSHTDVTERRQAEEELRSAHEDLEVRVRERTAELMAANKIVALATIDPVTGLPNHRAIVGAVDLELERSARFNRPCALLFLDIDHFKALNDGCGHVAGDAALAEFGAVVQGCLRGIDTVGRWGGEEFVALLPETDRDSALILAEIVRDTIASHGFQAGGGGRLTCSQGVAVFPDDAGDRFGLVAAADRAMYAAKRLGRNQVRSITDPAVAALGAGDQAGSREEATLCGEVAALAALVAARDRYTGQHTDEVAALSIRLALALGQDMQAARMAGLVGQLHDVGKVAIPDAVLQKPGRLTEAEWALMRQHPVVGADVVSRMPSLRVIAPSIRGHHERWDGSGYPDGLAGEAIPLAARIVAVADAYGAMTTDRPYRRGMAPRPALEEMHRCAGTQFDAAVVAALGQTLQEYQECWDDGAAPPLRLAS